MEEIIEKVYRQIRNWQHSERIPSQVYPIWIYEYNIIIELLQINRSIDYREFGKLGAEVLSNRKG